MRRFELIEGTSSKFWEVSRDGATYTVRYGRIGTQGQTLSKTAASDARAQADVDKLVKEKTGKGYKEVGVDAGAALAAVAVEAPKPAPAAAPAAPAATEAPEPAAAAPAVAAPIAEASRRPASAAAPAGEFQYTAAWRRALPAQRGLPLHGAAPESPDALYAKLRERGDAHRGLVRWAIPNAGLGDVHKRHPLSKALARETLIEPDAAAWEAALMLCSALGDLPTVVELCVAEHGTAFAVHRYLAAIAALPMTASGSTMIALHSGIPELAAALARCTDDEYAAARSVLSREPANDTERYARGALFNTDAHLVAAAFAVLLPNAMYEYRGALGLTGVQLTLEQAARLVHDDALREAPEYARRLALNLARGHGAAAIPLLAQLFDRQAGSAGRTHVAEILRACDTVDAAIELVDRIDHKEVRAALDDIMRASPLTAMRAGVASAVRGRSKSVESWLTRMLGAHPALADALRAELDGTSRALVERLGGRLAAVVDAPADALPRVLRDPPWLKPQPQLARPALPDVPPPAPRMVWPDGLREQWKKPMPANDALDAASNRQLSRLSEALELLSIPRTLWSDLMSGAVADLAPHAAAIEDYRRSLTGYHRPRYIGSLAPLAPKFRLLLWNGLPAFDGYAYEGAPTAGTLIAHYELDALPGLLTFIASRLDAGLAAALPVGDARIARFAAQGLAGKKARTPAAAWLRAHAELATAALLAQAREGSKAVRESAESALRWLAANVDCARLAAGAAHYGEAGGALLDAIIAIDPLSLLPQKPRALPAFFIPGALARPRLADGSGVPVDALPALGTMLQVSLLDQPYAGLDEVRAACTPASLDAFAWDLFQAWYQSGAPSKESWAYAAVGLIGGEQCVRELTPLIRAWPGEAQHARAVAGLDILAAIGSDLALMNLNGIAQKAKFKGLQEKANEKIQAIADARGLTSEELADRLVPDLDLDADGTLVLDFGPRQFTVGFDEQLRPFVCDASGARLKDLPKPAKGDDRERAEAAAERWKALKKDAKAIAGNQVQRLELAMCSGRTFAFDVFMQFFVRHPLMRHLARRLLWGVGNDDGTVTAFRIAEDLTFADRNDETLQIDGDVRICLPHVLRLDADDVAGFGQVFADYEILQPFVQLGREVAAMDDAELAQTESLRFKGKRVATGSVYGLQHRGWRSGAAQDAGWIGWFEKALPGGLEACIELDPGTVAGDAHYEPKQTLGALSLRCANTWDDRGKRSFAALDAVTRSELLRDLERLAPLVE